MADRTSTEYIFWHTSASTGNLDVSADQIDDMHKAKGWSEIGYHYVVRQDGSIEDGRELDAVGAHAKGLNAKSVGICFSGHGDEADFSEAQYEAGLELTRTLMAKYEVPSERVLGHRELNSLVSAGSLESQYSTTKSCPGTKVDMDAVRAELEGPVLSFPVNLGIGLGVFAENVRRYYAHTEKDFPGGYFPVGTNTTWHGGLHIFGQRGKTLVRACASGEIVAARLWSDPAPGKGHGELGSVNFILLKHVFTAATLERANAASDQEEAEQECAEQESAEQECAEQESADEQVWYSLYAHLNPERPSADEGPFCDVRWIRCAQQLDEELLEQLACGDVVKVARDGQAIEVAAGEALWTMGEYGESDRLQGLVHMEIFSANNLMSSWDASEDTSEDYGMDAQEILALVDQDWWGSDEILTKSEVEDFYREQSKAASLRTRACRFVSEWGIDLDAAIEALSRHPANIRTASIKETVSPYLWWSEAKALGCELPAETKVWHYNPIALLDAVSLGARPAADPCAKGICSRAPSKVDSFKDYIELVACLECRSQLGAREVLSLLRLLYYDSMMWSTVIPCTSERAHEAFARLRGDDDQVLAALRRSKEVEGVDLGHVFTGLEAMCCPIPSVSNAIAHGVLEASQVGGAGAAAGGGLAALIAAGLVPDISNETWVTWAGDLGSQVAEHPFQPTLISNAKVEDMRGDLDPFIIRAELLGVAGMNANISLGQTPLSELLAAYYMSDLHLERRPKFLALLEAHVASSSPGKDCEDALLEYVQHDTLEFAKAFYIKVYGSRVRDYVDRLEHKIDQVMEVASDPRSWIMGVPASHPVNASIDAPTLESASHRIAVAFVNWLRGRAKE